jgi:hypothetical protein
MKRWFRVTAKRSDGHEAIYYVLSTDWESGAAERMLYDSPVTLSGMECDPSEVPWKVRARYEFTTEELRDALKARGWTVGLT